jgi:hypothetical protein
LTFGLFGFFTGSASARVTLIVVSRMTFLSGVRWSRPLDGPYDGGVRCLQPAVRPSRPQPMPEWRAANEADQRVPSVLEFSELHWLCDLLRPLDRLGFLQGKAGAMHP